MQGKFVEFACVSIKDFCLAQFRSIKDNIRVRNWEGV